MVTSVFLLLLLLEQVGFGLFERCWEMQLGKGEIERERECVCVWIRVCGYRECGIARKMLLVSCTKGGGLFKKCTDR